jgi:hypothetical protein
MKIIKGLILLLVITGCSSTGNRWSYNLDHYEDFNYMTQDLFIQNIRDCRSQNFCRAEDLFDRW